MERETGFSRILRDPANGGRTRDSPPKAVPYR